MNTCVRCGSIKFKTWLGFAAHMEASHQQKIVQPIKPTRTTDRTKGEIVNDMESFLREAIPSALLGHGEELKAFDSGLDRILAMQEGDTVL